MTAGKKLSKGGKLRRERWFVLLLALLLGLALGPEASVKAQVSNIDKSFVFLFASALTDPLQGLWQGLQSFVDLLADLRSQSRLWGLPPFWVIRLH